MNAKSPSPSHRPPDGTSRRLVRIAFHLSTTAGAIAWGATANIASAERLQYSFYGTSTTFAAGALSVQFGIDSADIHAGPPASFNTNSFILPVTKYLPGRFEFPPNPDSGSFAHDNLVSVDPTTGIFTGQQSGGIGIGGASVGVGGMADQSWFYSAPQNSEDRGRGRWQVSSPSHPLLPTSIEGPGQFTFSDVLSGAWADPQPASHYDYQMTSPDELFTSIVLPDGFASPFTISSGGNVLGIADGGQLFTFNTGVSEFAISGINPEVDASDASAFPVLLNFSGPMASFTMSSVPEASGALLTGIALAAGAIVLRGRMARTLSRLHSSR